ncbi:DUF3954 domain-containing protein [Bacillus thuringiensis]|uniref:DUF3954 domain-containing protein n=1 Tax=Bacillus thuringiensis TaxID=1428 RepID=UPI0032C4347B
MKREIDMKTNVFTLWWMEKINFEEPPKSGYGQQVLYWVKGKVSHTQTTMSCLNKTRWENNEYTRKLLS